MPSIAQFLRDGWAGPQYDPEYNGKIDERIYPMNVAQLQGMYNELEKASKNAKSKVWSKANARIMSQMEALLIERRTREEAINKNRGQ